MPQHPGPCVPWARSDRAIPRTVVRPLQRFLATSTSSGYLLLIALAVALAWANSPWSDAYERLWTTPLVLRLGETEIGTDLRFWIGEGLMTVFFLLVGMEIKREVTSGELRDPRVAALPAIAAVGGMVVPALIYLAIVGDGPAARGWGVPMATDIALALGALALASRFITPDVRPFLLTLAIVDDIGAIVVVTVFYAAGGTPVALLWAAAIVAVIVLAERARIHVALVYVVLGIALWYAFLRAGIEPAIAGVVLGLLTPAEAIGRLERSLLLWSGFVIVPLFALANAGVDLSPSTLFAGAGASVAIAIVLARLVGKPLGVVVASRLAVWTGTATARIDRGSILGVGVTAGIGFTVSLFIADLAFAAQPALLDAAKLSIMVSAAIAGLVSVLTFRVVAARQPPRGVPR
jgi:NhaA family Na+:H+ antiporter